MQLSLFQFGRVCKYDRKIRQNRQICLLNLNLRKPHLTIVFSGFRHQFSNLCMDQRYTDEVMFAEVVLLTTEAERRAMLRKHYTQHDPELDEAFREKEPTQEPQRENKVKGTILLGLFCSDKAPFCGASGTLCFRLQLTVPMGFKARMDSS